MSSNLMLKLRCAMPPVLRYIENTPVEIDELPTINIRSRCTVRFYIDQDRNHLKKCWENIWISFQNICFKTRIKIQKYISYSSTYEYVLHTLIVFRCLFRFVVKNALLRLLQFSDKQCRTETMLANLRDSNPWWVQTLSAPS